MSKSIEAAGARAVRTALAPPPTPRAQPPPHDVPVLAQEVEKRWVIASCKSSTEVMYPGVTTGPSAHGTRRSDEPRRDRQGNREASSGDRFFLWPTRAFGVV